MTHRSDSDDDFEADTLENEDSWCQPWRDITWRYWLQVGALVYATIVMLFIDLNLGDDPTDIDAWKGAEVSPMERSWLSSEPAR